MIAKFQTGFIWPLFDISLAVLQALEFIEPSDDAPSSIRIYDTTLRARSKVPLGFVVNVRESKFVFIKHSDVHHCTGFDDILATTSS